MNQSRKTLREQILDELRRRGDLTEETVQPPTLADFVEHTVNFELHDWQRRFLCPILERCAHEKGVRIAIHGPPQFGKSIIVSQRLPAWLLGLDPIHRVGLACYNETRSTQFGDVVKQIICSPQFGDQFPSVQVAPDAPSGRFSTAQRAALLDAQPSFTAMGLLSGFVGRGVDTLIVDDPYKSSDEARSEVINEKVWRWWSETAKVRIDPAANVLVMFHRYHEDDFAGRLLAEGFEYVRFPAIADKNEDGSDPTGRADGELLSPMRSREFLDAINEEDPLVFAGQFQGVPRPAGGGFFQREWFKVAPIPPLKAWVRFWDIAVSEKETGDFTVGALCAMGPDQKVYLKNIIRFRAEWPEAHEHILQVTKQDALECSNNGSQYAVGIDARLSQQGFFQQLMKAPIFDPDNGKEVTVALHPQKTNKDKKTLASGWAAKARLDGFRMAQDPTWNQEFIKEALAFTGSEVDRHDDQIDAVSGAYELIWALAGNYTYELEKKPEVGSPAWFGARRRRTTGEGIFRRPDQGGEYNSRFGA